MGHKIFAMLRQAFGHDHRVYAVPEGAYGLDGLSWIALAVYLLALLSGRAGLDDARSGAAA